MRTKGPRSGIIGLKLQSNVPRTIRTVADLASLSDVELTACLQGLRDAINARKRAHATAVAAGSIASNFPLGFTGYVWKPNPGTESKWSPAYPPTAPVRELPIRAGTCIQQESERILCLEDLSAISARELLACEDMGAVTVRRLRELLLSIGDANRQPLRLSGPSASDSCPKLRPRAAGVLRTTQRRSRGVSLRSARTEVQSVDAQAPKAAVGARLLIAGTVSPLLRNEADCQFGGPADQGQI